MRSVLFGLFLPCPALDDEALCTLFTEVENIVNSYPLTADNLSDPAVLEPITPNHLLTCKAKLVQSPPANFFRPNPYTKKRWCGVQYLAQQFWCRWQQEYCILLKRRQKWNNVSPCSQICDIVLIREESCTRNQWPFAKATKVFPRQEGRVRKYSFS